MEKKINIFSFFSGAGFLDLGFESCNYDIVYVNEYYRPFLETYEFSRKFLGVAPPRFGLHEMDITQLTNEKGKEELSQCVDNCKQEGNIVGFIGGPPCPDFSVGGKNKGREGENGKLSDTYVELITQQKPDFFLFENVKGLWKTKKHREFYEEIKLKLNRNGYLVTERLIDTIEYGVPQRRERIILIGFQKEFLIKRGKLIGDSYVLHDWEFPWLHYQRYSVQQIEGIPWPGTSSFRANSKIDYPEGIPIELTVEYWFEKNDVSRHPNSKNYFQPRAGLRKFEVIPEGDDSKKSYKRLHRWRYSPTAAYGNNEVHLHPYQIRRISVAEALAIQSLPMQFVLPQNITLSDAFKTVGNGVPYLAAKAIAQSILDFLNIELPDKGYFWARNENCD
ncbi:MAG: DNA cytosine methyltransferase [Neobacillus sp.]